MDSLNQNQQKIQSNLPPKKPQADDLSFFHVMPQDTGDNSVLGHAFSVTQNSPQTPPGGESVYLKYFLTGTAIIILAGGSYFAVTKFYRPEIGSDLTVQAPKTPEPGQDAVPLPYAQEKEWLEKYFKNPSCENENECGEGADPEIDGLKNGEELLHKTDPNNNDSDQDGLADGDEVHVFNSDPMNKYTAGDQNYSDSDFLKGGYNIKAPDKLLTPEEIQQLSLKMTERGLHPPTLKTLGDALLKIYAFGAGQPQTQAQPPEDSPEEIDNSPEAKADRDAQRYNTTKNISIALIKYYEDNKIYPEAANFSDLVKEIKLYNRVATNPVDPINKDPYGYSYQAENKGADLILTYYSETQDQVIKIRAKDAQKIKTAEEALTFDEQRKNDLDFIRSALLLYSSSRVDINQEYVFPTKDKYKIALMPTYLSSIPKDPQTGKDYEYLPSADLAAFELKAILSAPPAGSTGFMCNQEECKYY